MDTQLPLKRQHGREKKTHSHTTQTVRLLSGEGVLIALSK